LFEQAVARFTEDLPSLQEEQENPELVAAVLERLEEFQVFGDFHSFQLLCWSIYICLQKKSYAKRVYFADFVKIFFSATQI